MAGQKSRAFPASRCWPRRADSSRRRGRQTRRAMGTDGISARLQRRAFDPGAGQSRRAREGPLRAASALSGRELRLERWLARAGSTPLPSISLFGGGTAFARAYRIVRRVSENVDFKIVPRAAASVSRSALRRWLDHLRLRVSAAALQAAGFAFDAADKSPAGGHKACEGAKPDGGRGSGQRLSARPCHSAKPLNYRPRNRTGFLTKGRGLCAIIETWLLTP
jgi:hypothetical protein